MVFSLFLTFSNILFFTKLINNINLFFKQDKKVEKKAPSKPLKEVKVPDNIKKEKKETPAKQPVTTEPISQKQDFLDLLDQNVDESSSVTKEYLEDLSLNLVAKLQEFGIEGKVEGSFPGPVITRFEINLAPGTKASQVTNIANDLARSLAVKSVRVVEVIEGKSSIGIEIPNPKT